MSRTVTYNYAVGGNPLVTSVADAAGTITTTSDLLGRAVSYTDVWGDTDAFHFVQRPADSSTHIALTYRIVSLDNTSVSLQHPQVTPITERHDFDFRCRDRFAILVEGAAGGVADVVAVAVLE